MAAKMTAPLLCLLALSLTISGAAAARSLLAAATYTGPPSFTVQDTNPLHIAANCTAVAGAPNGCVPLTLTLTISDATVSYAYALKLPSGAVLKTGVITAGTTGSITVLVPWGQYPVTFTFGTNVASISLIVVGFTEYSATVPNGNALQTDAKLGYPVTTPRNAYYALQKNNSVYTPGRGLSFVSGSSTHYHNSSFWQLVMDPLHKGAEGYITFARCIHPYFGNGTEDNTGTLLDQYPTRTTNHNFLASIGDTYGYASTTRKPCTLVAGPDLVYPKLTAAHTYVCDYTFPSRYFTYTAQQDVDPTKVAKGQMSDDYATKLSLIFSSVFSPFFPTYTGALP